MNEIRIAPDTVEQLREIIAAEDQVIAVGKETKLPLSRCPDATRISLKSIRGITQYEPSEFTFTAWSGTPLAEIIAALTEKNQYLPFDPPLVAAGATIGGTVAAGLSGPGRFRFGGIRDFLLSVHFISGDGKLIRAGGKVVKNAAGFDIPKFMVGSLGRLGVTTELTFKVFPKPAATMTLMVECESHAQAMDRMAVAGSATWELDAIDYAPDQQSILLRIGGPDAANRSIAKQVLDTWGDEVLLLEDSDSHWGQVRELRLRDDHPIIAKIPTTPPIAKQLCDRLAGGLRLCAAANVAWYSMRDDNHVSETSRVLSDLGASGLVIRGPSDHVRIGTWDSSEIESALKTAFDPMNKFPHLDTDHAARNQSN